MAGVVGAIVQGDIPGKSYADDKGHPQHENQGSNDQPLGQRQGNNRIRGGIHGANTLRVDWFIWSWQVS
jgi:hypothetical protein